MQVRFKFPARRMIGKVRPSHRTDEEEFPFLSQHADDVDLNKKLEKWEKHYNLNQPHTSHGGFTHYEILRAKPENKKIQYQPKSER